MKRIIVLVLALVIFLLLSTTSSIAREAYFDNFNKEELHDWWQPAYCLSKPWELGNWWVDDGVLVQDYGCDGALAFIKDSQFSDQILEVDLKLRGPSGYGGFMIWFQNNYNSVFTGVSNGRIGVSEVENNVWTAIVYPFDYNINYNKWVNFKVVVDGATGDLDIYAGGVYQLTHHLTTSNRTGQSGLYTGNAGAYFDNFSVRSHYPKPIY